MNQPRDYPFARYLAAKKSIDDRALNPHVWGKLAQFLSQMPGDDPLRILEVGAGIGTMIERLLERNLLRYAEYTAVDNQPENLLVAHQRLENWGRRHRARIESQPAAIHLEGDQCRLLTLFEVADVQHFIHRSGSSGYNLLIAHAFLDLVDVPSTLPGLLSLIQPEGAFYFSLNFDGLTLLEPAIDLRLDELVQTLYHQSMDARLVDGKPSGDSRTGRRLFIHLKNAGAEILAAGGSDWVIYPQMGRYPEDEAFFLHFIIHTIDQALRGHPALEPGAFADWVAERHAQVERGELVYIAHQLDFFGRRNA